MKLWTSIIVAGAVLAIVAPSAFTAGAAIPADSTSGITHQVTGKASTKVAKAVLLNKKQASKLEVLTAQNKALRAKNARLAAQNASQAATNRAQAAAISELNAWVWAHTDHPAPVVDPDADCRDYSVCTPEQDCRIWGNGCSLVTPPVAQDVSTPSAPVDDSGSQSSVATPPPAAQPAPLECASMVDPAIVEQNPVQYDSTC